MLGAMFEDTDLKLAPPPDEGNPSTKYIIAAIVMVVIGLAIFLFNPWKTAEATLVKTEFYAPPTQVATPDPVMYPGSTPPPEDDLYVVTTVKITDKLRLPISPNASAATLITSDGNAVDGRFVAESDIPRLEQEFPALTPMLNDPGATPIKTGETISPGQTRVGTIVLLFPQVTKAKWDAKKMATLTINFARQKSYDLNLP
jgi:hypothetical protein